MNTGYDATVLRGNPEQRSFSLAYLREGVVIPTDCVNATRDYAQGRKLIQASIKIDPETFADTRTSSKNF